MYVGGEVTVRGYAELRLRIGGLNIGDGGVFGLADAGRAWIAGESSD